jgi:single-strand DNA-binding protein
MARSLNKVELIGNLTRDPELRYTPQGTAVCTFGMATNRQWTTDTGEKKEDVEFHRIVSWNKLAELCAQLLSKGRKVYVQGRLQTRRWTAQDGSDRVTTEIVINDMIILDSRYSAPTDQSGDFDIPDEEDVTSPEKTEKKTAPVAKKGSETKKASKSPRKKSGTSRKKKTTSKKSSSRKKTSDSEDDDIPF